MTRDRARALVFAVLAAHDRDLEHWRRAERLAEMSLPPPKNLTERFIDLLERLQEPE